MGTYYTDTLYASRILNASLVDQSGSDDGYVTNWIKTDAFVLAVTMYCGSGTSRNPVAGTYQVQWRNVTAAGSFANVTSSGEIAYTSSTNLTDNSTIASAVCGVPAGYSFTSAQSFQVEDSLSPSSDLGAAGCAEMRFGLTAAGGTNGNQYEFQITDPTNTLTIGTAGATLTLKETVVKFIMIVDDEILTNTTGDG